MFRKGLCEVPEVLSFLYRGMPRSNKCPNYCMKAITIKISGSRRHLRTSEKQATYLHAIYIFKSLLVA